MTKTFSKPTLPTTTQISPLGNPHQVLVESSLESNSVPSPSFPELDCTSSDIGTDTVCIGPLPLFWLTVQYICPSLSTLSVHSLHFRPQMSWAHLSVYETTDWRVRKRVGNDRREKAICRNQTEIPTSWLHWCAGTNCVKKV